MKNKIKKLLIVSAALSSLYACSTKQELASEQNHDNILLSIDPSISNTLQSRSSLAYSTKESWANNDKFGFYANLSIDTLNLAESPIRGVDFANLPFVYNGTKFNSTPSTLYFPYREQNLDMWGVYPFDANIKTKNAAIYPWSVKADQSTGIIDADFMVAIKQKVVPTSDQLGFEFKHKMTHLVFDILKPESIDGRKVVAIQQITLHNVKLNATYNFNKDIVSVVADSKPSDMVPHFFNAVATGALGAENRIYEAIIVPQTIPAGTFMQVIVEFEPDPAGLDGDTGLFSFRFDSNALFQSGEQHHYTLEFNTDFTIRLTGSKIENWNEMIAVELPEIEEV